MTILSYVKVALAVDFESTAFDVELLSLINVAVSVLSQLGVIEYDDLVVDASTAWPIFVDRTIIKALSKNYIGQAVKLVFDPTPSATIQGVREEALKHLEARLIIETNEVDDEEVT